MIVGGVLTGLLGLAAVTLAMTGDAEPEAVGPTTTSAIVDSSRTIEPTTPDSTISSTTEATTPDSSSTSPPSTTTTTKPATTTTDPPPPTTTDAPTPAPPPAPGFESSVRTLTADDLHSSWREGCPLGVDELRAVDVTHWGYNDSARTGTLVVAAGLTDAVIAIMRDLYEARFPIERMDPVDVFGGSDDDSMAANNTSAFNCRPVSGGSSWSEHSYGRAIDINPLVNPYVRGSTVLPPQGARYADRSLDAQGMIHAGDEVVTAFADRGWIWGGTWSSLKDYQHFSTSGR